MPFHLKIVIQKHSPWFQIAVTHDPLPTLSEVSETDLEAKRFQMLHDIQNLQDDARREYETQLKKDLDGAQQRYELLRWAQDELRLSAEIARGAGYEFAARRKDECADKLEADLYSFETYIDSVRAYLEELGQREKSTDPF